MYTQFTDCCIEILGKTCSVKFGRLVFYCINVFGGIKINRVMTDSGTCSDVDSV